MGVKEWIQSINGWFMDDDNALYIVDIPVQVPQQREPPYHLARIELQWDVVERHVPNYEAKHVAGPFPTLDGAKAAYIVLAPRYPGP